MSRSLYDPSVLQSSPQATAASLKKLFVGGIEQLKAVHQQMLTQINAVDRNQLETLLPTLEQDFRALSEFIGRYDQQFNQSLPARQGIQAMGGPVPTPLPDENIDPQTLQPLTRKDVPAAQTDPSGRITYNDENIQPDDAHRPVQNQPQSNQPMPMKDITGQPETQDGNA